MSRAFACYIDPHKLTDGGRSPIALGTRILSYFLDIYYFHPLVPSTVITQCVVSRLYEEGAASQPATDLAKTFERRKCNHWQVKDADGECITGIIGKDNRYRYCVATQSPATRGQLRRVPGVPILFEARGMILLEPPSDASVGQRKHVSFYCGNGLIGHAADIARPISDRRIKAACIERRIVNVEA